MSTTGAPTDRPARFAAPPTHPATLLTIAVKVKWGKEEYSVDVDPSEV
jgi:hypothetical protein